MGDSIFKDAWTTLTVAIPGLVSYGLWRLLLLFGDDWRIGNAHFSQADDSAVLTTAFIVAIAIGQQAVAIALEALIAVALWAAASEDNPWRKLFHDRFRIHRRSEMSEDARRIVGQFFLSLNVLIGLCGVLLYFVLVECKKEHTGTISIFLVGLIAFALAACLFRAWGAKQAIADGATNGHRESVVLEESSKATFYVDAPPGAP